MARKPAKKPAEPAEQPAKQPASRRKAVKKANVTINDIANKVDMDPKSVRARVRRLLGDGKAVVGRGRRYGWSSWNDPQVKRIMKALTGKAAA